MLKFFFLPFLFVFVFSFAFSSARADETTLGLGSSMEWKAPPRAAISVSNGSVVRVADKGAHLKITGKKLGVSVVRAGQQTLEVRVVSEPVARLRSRFVDLLAERRGLKVEIENKEVVIRGELLRFEDWVDLSQLADHNHLSWRFEARMSDEIKERAQAYFKNLLRISKLPDLAFELRPSAVVSIPTKQGDLRSKVVFLLGSYGFRVEDASSALSLQPLVRVQILVAEVRRTVRKTLGVGWPDAVGARLIPGPLGLVGDGLILNLQALEEKGLGRILASPTLLCRSGEEATFLAGGEFPIKNVHYKSSEVTWKKHGVLLQIRPQADFSGRMSIGLTTEVSVLDDATKVDGVPGLLINRIESHFDLTSSRTIALSGLIKKEWGDKLNGLPGLATLPVIGSLFSSRDFRDHQTELMVFVTPKIAEESVEDSAGDSLTTIENKSSLQMPKDFFSQEDIP